MRRGVSECRWRNCVNNTKNRLVLRRDQGGGWESRLGGDGEDQDYVAPFAMTNHRPGGCLATANQKATV